MTVRAFLGIVLSAAIATGMGTVAANAQSCTAADFGAIVDQTAQALRDLNSNGGKRFQTKVAALRDKNKLSQADVEARIADLHDSKIEEFNREIEMLVAQMDVLSQMPSSKITCDKLEELKRVRDRLLTSMGLKSGYMLARVEDELERVGPRPVSAPRPEPEPEAVKPAPFTAMPVSTPKTGLLDIRPPVADTNPAPAPVAALPATKPQTAPDAKPLASDTKPLAADTRPLIAVVEEKPLPPANIKPAPTKTAALDQTPLPGLPERSPGPRMARNVPPASSERGALPPPSYDERPTTLAPPPAGGVASLPPGSNSPSSTGANEAYSIAEIREIGRGVFGTITAEFAGAINYAFQQFGQPNAYITGYEGGAAILAGLRYGKGEIFHKVGQSSPIYWQGPSAGLDIGAEGSSSLFLVYNLDDPVAIYGRFSGIGGSAYVAGGVGLNVLGKGGVIMVPIRSGLGLRLGANLAYVKFTERQTWNPF